MTRLRCVPASLGLLLTLTSLQLFAQPARTVQPGQGLFRSRYNAAAEVRIDGTIQELVTRRTVGSPAGVHLLVSGTQGIVDAHLGPFLSKERRAALRSGIPVQVVGYMTQLNGKQYLLARELTVEGRVITVRSSRGFPVADLSGRPNSMRRLRATQAKGSSR